MNPEEVVGRIDELLAGAAPDVWVSGDAMRWQPDAASGTTGGVVAWMHVRGARIMTHTTDPLLEDHDPARCGCRWLNRGGDDV